MDTTNWTTALLTRGACILRAGRRIATFDNDEDARRATACVNACRTMQDPATAIAGLVADAGYLKVYRAAYIQHVAQLSQLRELVASGGTLESIRDLLAKTPAPETEV